MIFSKNNIVFIQKAFAYIVKLCKEPGICKAGTIILDGTKLKANTSADRSKIKEQYEQWFERIDADSKIYQMKHRRLINRKTKVW